MGHETKYMEFPKNTSKQEMFARRACIIEACGDRDPSDGSLVTHDNGFTLHDGKVYSSYSDAIDAINKFDNGFYDDHGVLFKESKAKSKARLDLQDKIQETRRKKREFYNNHLPSKAKATFVGCPECKSKLAKEFLETDRCPVCKKSMFPKTTKDRLKAYDAKLKQLEAKDLELERKQKGEVKWLVKLEFHT